jgi:response regulator RpfG family c-di-GMP phosphodiesterase
MSAREKECIICVDDEQIVLQSLKEEFRRDPFFGDIAIEISDSPLKVAELILDVLADGYGIPVILSDQRMPGINGDQMLLAVRNLVPDTKNILLTGFADLPAVTRLVNGDSLYRFISKPWIREDLLLTVKDACRAWRQQRVINQLTTRIESLSYAMVTALENANTYFDEDTGNHVHRISILSEFIGKSAGLEANFVRLVKLYSPLHDIGKVGIKKDILLKPGALTADEFQHIKEHVAIGFQIINNENVDAIAKNIVLYHHEKWSGSGYLAGLQGEKIPLEARIVAIADVFDALVSKRVYKDAMPVEKALNIIEEGRGTHFDPNLVDAFLSKFSDIHFPDDLYGQKTGLS